MSVATNERVLRIRANILKLAPKGVRIYEVPGDSYWVKKVISELLAAGLLVQRTTFNRDIKIYFDCKASATLYFSGATDLQPPKNVMSPAYIPKMDVKVPVSYETLNTKELSKGWRQSV